MFCIQAKESDPEHSVKFSGLAYIALVALHRFIGVSRKIDEMSENHPIILPIYLKCPQISPFNRCSVQLLTTLLMFTIAIDMYV